jgi:hypothetical protein
LSLTAAFFKLECRSNLGRITQWQPETDGLRVGAHFLQKLVVVFPDKNFPPIPVEKVYVLFWNFN